MSGTLTQAPKQATPHRAATTGDHHIHIPHIGWKSPPNLLRVYAAAIGAFALLAAIVTTGYASDAHTKIGSVRSTDAPSVSAAEDFILQARDMDAQLLNALLVNGDGSVHVLRAASVKLYEADRKNADADLESANKALTDHAALQKLNTVVDLFGSYQEAATRALQEDEKNGGSVAGKAPDSVLQDYRAANSVLTGPQGLLGTARDLVESSKTSIGDSSSAVTGTLDTTEGAFVFLGLLLVAGLVLLQVRLARRFKRTLNPALLAAMVVALVLGIGGAASANAARQDFVNAKSNAFDSVLSLTQAKADSYGINADESRWLLFHGDSSTADGFQQSFYKNANLIANVGTADPAQYATALDGELSQRNPENLDATGLINDQNGFDLEFRNITFDGEAQAAVYAFSTYDTYIKADQKLRAFDLTTAQGLTDAINFDTNADTPGTSDRVFTDYSNALDTVIGINQTEFDKSAPAAESAIGVWSWLPYILALAVIGLVVVGLWPRINEYRS